MDRRRMAAVSAVLAMAMVGAGGTDAVRAQEPAKSAPAMAQSPGSPAPVVTEARRREIIQAAQALTSDTLAETVRRAEAGDVEAQVLAGIAFLDGKVVPEDVDQSASWIRAAAETGHPMGQNMLGNLYNSGSGMPQDPVKAVEWFGKAAAQGYAQAQNNLGAAYRHGRGVAANAAEASRLFRLAAEQGNIAGQVNLAFACSTGQGVATNEREAAAWFREAAEQGDPVGQIQIGLAYYQGRGVGKDKGEAERWYKKASDQGDATGSYFYGLLYLEKPAPGRTDPIGTQIAVEALQLSARRGFAVAAYALGDLFSGRIFKYHVTKDELAACAWYVTASSLDTQGGFDAVPPVVAQEVRKDLPKRLEKSRKDLGAGLYAECERRAASWMAAHVQKKPD